MVVHDTISETGTVVRKNGVEHLPPLPVSRQGASDGRGDATARPEDTVSETSTSERRDDLPNVRPPTKVPPPSLPAAAHVPPIRPPRSLSPSPSPSPMPPPRMGPFGDTRRRTAPPDDPPPAAAGLPKDSALPGAGGAAERAEKAALLGGTVGPKGFALHDKLLAVYAAGNTVPIPFLRALEVSPIALLSSSRDSYTDGGGGTSRAGGRGLSPDHSGLVALETIQELYSGAGLGEGGIRRGRRQTSNEMPLPPSVYRRLATSTTLPNLARALAYHKHSLEEMPMASWHVQSEHQICNNLSDTLRTILRL